MVHNVGHRRGTVESGVDRAKKTAPKETALRTRAAQSSVNRMGEHWADNCFPGTTNAGCNHIPQDRGRHAPFQRSPSPPTNTVSGPRPFDSQLETGVRLSTVQTILSNRHQ